MFHIKTIRFSAKTTSELLQFDTLLFECETFGFRYW